MNWCHKYKFEIIKIEWERIFLTFELVTDCPRPLEFVLVNMDLTAQNKVFAAENNRKPDLKKLATEQVKIEPKSCEDGVYTFNINITAANGRKFLNNGQWQVAAITEDGLAVATVTTDLAYQLVELTRTFPYGEKKYMYNFFFDTVCFEKDKLEIVFNSFFTIANEKWKKRKYIQEAITRSGKLNRLKMFTVIRLIRAFYKVMSNVMPKDGTRVLFMSETKEYLWGNLKYIDDRMKARGLDKQFKLSYSFRKSVGNSSGVMSWVKAVYNIAKHDYIFIDDYAPVFGFFKLHKKTKLIQVWHAGEGFKSVGYSRFGKEGSPFPSESCHKAYTYALTGSPNLVKVYEEVFGIEKSAFLPVGMARLDDFMDENKIIKFREDFYKEYPMLDGKKIVLFAPTFRGAGQREAYYDYDILDLKEIYDFCGDEFVFLFKMHPFVREKIEIPAEYSDRLYDFTSYPNINDLYYVTELLITDYSSNYYEYALMKKPALFFTYDREMYELTRGVHRSVKDFAPGKVCDTFEEMITALHNRDFEIEKIYKFVEENFGEYDGHACDRAIDQILLKE